MSGRKGKAVVVGGSIGGLSCVHALLAAGWDVVVVEKCEAPKGSPTGPGLALDPQSLKFRETWLREPDLLRHITLPLAVDENRAIDSNEKNSRILTRDESFNCRCAHWSDIHGLLYKYLPSEIVRWGRQFLCFRTSDDKASVAVETKVLQTDEVIEIHADLLIAADGFLSAIRRHFLPHLKLRWLKFEDERLPTPDRQLRRWFSHMRDGI